MYFTVVGKLSYAFRRGIDHADSIIIVPQAFFLSALCSIP